MATYDTILDYISCSTSVSEKIAKIDSIIEALEDAELSSALSSGDIEEYSLDDGQTKIKTVIRDSQSIEKAILALERRKNRILNANCIGRVVKLRDKDSFLLNKGNEY